MNDVCNILFIYIYISHFILSSSSFIKDLIMMEFSKSYSVIGFLSISFFQNTPKSRFHFPIIWFEAIYCNILTGFPPSVLEFGIGEVFPGSFNSVFTPLYLQCDSELPFHFNSSIFSHCPPQIPVNSLLTYI